MLTLCRADRTASSTSSRTCVVARNPIITRSTQAGKRRTPASPTVRHSSSFSHRFDFVREICTNLSVSAILIEHKIASAMKIADQVMIINSGKLVFNGTKAEAEQINLWDYF